MGPVHEVATGVVGGDSKGGIFPTAEMSCPGDQTVGCGPKPIRFEGDCTLEFQEWATPERKVSAMVLDKEEVKCTRPLRVGGSIRSRTGKTWWDDPGNPGPSKAVPQSGRRAAGQAQQGSSLLSRGWKLPNKCDGRAGGEMTGASS